MRNNKYGDQLFGQNGDGTQFFEDTHDVRGNFVGGTPKNTKTQPGVFYEAPKAMPQQVPQGGGKTSYNAAVRNYNNVVVYEPRTPNDVQCLIDYLKRHEQAVINLNGVDEESAQRILDFCSGAVYALNGNIHRISSNIFLLTPEGVVITAPI